MVNYNRKLKDLGYSIKKYEYSCDIYYVFNKKVGGCFFSLEDAFNCYNMNSFIL